MAPAATSELLSEVVFEVFGAVAGVTFFASAFEEDDTLWIKRSDAANTMCVELLGVIYLGLVRLSVGSSRRGYSCMRSYLRAATEP